MAKVITFDLTNGVEETYIIQDEYRISKEFIMEKIKDILMDDEGEFMVRDFSISVSDATNFLSDNVSMHKCIDKLKENSHK